jgi:hypothetical protein
VTTPPPGRLPTTLIDNASLLNACHLLAGTAEMTAVGIHDLGTVVQALLLSERIETLAGSTYATLMAQTSSRAWDLSSAGNLFRSLRSQGILSLRVIDASWHHDVLQGRAELDAFASLLDLNEIAAATTLDEVGAWRDLVFGKGMEGKDSTPIYAAPPSSAEGPVDLRDRRLDPASLFVSQTLLYCWQAYENDLPLMLSAIRRRIGIAASEALSRASRSALAAGLEAVDSADARFIADIATRSPLAVSSFAIPAPLAFVLAEATQPADILRVAVEARDDRRFATFRAWVDELQDALDGGDMRRFRRLAAMTQPAGRAKGPSAGQALVTFAVEPRALLARLVSNAVDTAAGRLRPRLTLIADISSGSLRQGGGLARLESLLGASIQREELAKLADFAQPATTSRGDRI